MHSMCVYAYAWKGFQGASTLGGQKAACREQPVDFRGRGLTPCDGFSRAFDLGISTGTAWSWVIKGPRKKLTHQQAACGHCLDSMCVYPNISKRCQSNLSDTCLHHLIRVWQYFVGVLAGAKVCVLLLLFKRERKEKEREK